MSRGNGSSPAGTPSMDSFRGSCPIFSTRLKSRKVSVNGSWAMRSRAVGLFHNRPGRTVSSIITRIGVSLVVLWSVGIDTPPSVWCELGDATFRRWIDSASADDLDGDVPTLELCKLLERYVVGSEMDGLIRITDPRGVVVEADVAPRNIVDQIAVFGIGTGRPGM